MVLPLYHAYGMIAILCRGCFGGVKIVVLPKYEPELFLSSIEKFKVLNGWTSMCMKVQT